MTTITKAATRLRDLCTRHGDHPAARGATEDEIAAIKETFATLEFPLPSSLLDVYRITLGVPGVLNDQPVLMAPCTFSQPKVIGHVRFLSRQLEDSRKEGVLWLGHGNEADLIIDRDGQCALEPEFQDDGTVRLLEPTDFEAAFLAYVERHVAEITEEFEEA